MGSTTDAWARARGEGSEARATRGAGREWVRGELARVDLLGLARRGKNGL